MKGNKLLFAAGLLLSIGVSSAWAADMKVRVNEVMAGYNGNSSIQFVELLVANDNHKRWGPQGTETAGRAQLQFYDGKNRRTGRYVFSKNPPVGGRTVLVATSAYAVLENAITPDFTMPREIMPISGKVCFTNNPDNANAAQFSSCVRYGDQAKLVPPLPIMGAQVLKRTRGFDFSIADPGNAAFELGSPTPVSTAIVSTPSIVTNAISAGGHVFAALPLEKQGEKLFMAEKFEGNSRTCGTCHIPPFFNMTPKHVAAKSFWGDPLFIAEKSRNINLMRLTVRSTPGDLRGQIKDATGKSALIVKGSGNKFLITRGLGLQGIVTDKFGNKGKILSITEGDLALPNGLSAHGLESSARLRESASPKFPQGRALVLENVDGFGKLEVFRKSPPLLNLKFTAPYGFNGVQNGLDPDPSKQLAEFTKGAVIQHFPLSLQRRPGTDFRLPTPGELDALVEFQESIKHEPLGNPRLGINDPNKALHNVTTVAQLKGAEHFDTLCRTCHLGSVMAENGLTPGRTIPINTMVANSPINLSGADALPTEPPGLVLGNSTRRIDTPQLMGLRFIAPYFHDASAATLEDVIDFYDSPIFERAFAGFSSEVPGGAILGRPGSLLPPKTKEELITFLRTLVEKLPVDFPRGFSFGTKKVNSISTETVSISNTSGGPVKIRSSELGPFWRAAAILSRGQQPPNRFDLKGLPQVVHVGAATIIPPSSDMAHFSVFPATLVGTTIPAGGTLDITVQFHPKAGTPAEAPFWSSMLTLSLEETNNGEKWDIGIQLIGKSNP